MCKKIAFGAIFGVMRTIPGYACSNCVADGACTRKADLTRNRRQYPCCHQPTPDFSSPLLFPSLFFSSTTRIENRLISGGRDGCLRSVWVIFSTNQHKKRLHPEIYLFDRKQPEPIPKGSAKGGSLTAKGGSLQELSPFLEL